MQDFSDKSKPESKTAETTSSPLMSAIENGNSQLVASLLEDDPSLANQTNLIGQTPLHIAVTKKSKEIIEILLKFNANIKKRDGSSKRAIDYALDDFELLEFLLQKGFKLREDSDLFSSKVVVEFEEDLFPNPLPDDDQFPDSESDLESESKPSIIPDEKSPSSSESEASLLHSAIKNNKIDSLKLLLEGEANPNQKIYESGESCTPLQYAARLGHLEIAQLLLSNGALVNGDKKGRSPLLEAMTKNSFPMIELLLQHGAFLALDSPEGSRLLLQAVQSERHVIVNCLLAQYMGAAFTGLELDNLGDLFEEEVKPKVILKSDPVLQSFEQKSKGLNKERQLTAKELFEIFSRDIRKLIADPILETTSGCWIDYLDIRVRMLAGIDYNDSPPLSAYKYINCLAEGFYKHPAHKDLFSTETIYVFPFPDKAYCGRYKNEKFISAVITAENIEIFNYNIGRQLEENQQYFERFATCCNLTPIFHIKYDIFALLIHSQHQIIDSLIKLNKEFYLPLIKQLDPIEYGFRYTREDIFSLLVSEDVIISVKLLLQHGWHFTFKHALLAAQSNAERTLLFFLSELTLTESEKNQLAEAAAICGNINMLAGMGIAPDFYFHQITQQIKSDNLNIEDFSQLILNAYFNSSVAKVDQCCEEYLTYVAQHFPHQQLLLKEAYQRAREKFEIEANSLDRYTKPSSRLELNYHYKAQADVKSELQTGSKYYDIIRIISDPISREKELRKRAKELKEIKAIPILEEDAPKDFIKARDLIILLILHRAEIAKNKGESNHTLYRELRDPEDIMFTPMLLNRYAHMFPIIETILNNQDPKLYDEHGYRIYFNTFKGEKINQVSWHPKAKVDQHFISIHWRHDFALKDREKFWAAFVRAHVALCRMDRDQIIKNPKEFYEQIAIGLLVLNHLTFTRRGTGFVGWGWFASMHSKFKIKPPTKVRNVASGTISITFKSEYEFIEALLNFFEPGTLLPSALKLLATYNQSPINRGLVKAFERMGITLYGYTFIAEEVKEEKKLKNPLNNNGTLQAPSSEPALSAEIKSSTSQAAFFTYDSKELNKAFYTELPHLCPEKIKLFFAKISNRDLKIKILNGKIDEAQDSPLVLVAKLAQAKAEDVIYQNKCAEVIRYLLEQEANPDTDFLSVIRQVPGVVSKLSDIIQGLKEPIQPAANHLVQPAQVNSRT